MPIQGAIETNSVPPREIRLIGETARRKVENHFRAIAVLLAVACGAAFAYLIRIGWFADDDFTNFTVAERMGLTPAYLLRPILDTRVSPGHRLVDWLVLQWPGHEWTVVVIISALSLAVATLFVALLANELTGSALLAIVTAAVFGTWVGWIRIGLWWPTGAHSLPATAFMLVALWLIVRWSRSRRNSDLALITVTMLVALAFSSRASLVPAIAAVILFVYQPSTRSLALRGILTQVRANWPPIVLTIVAAVGFVYLESRTAGFQDRPVPTPTEWLELARLWVLDAQAAFALNRVPLPGQGFLSITLVGLTVWLAIIVGTVRGSRSALIWLSIAVLVAICGFQVGWARLGQFGIDVVAFDTRYHEGDIVVFAVLIPCAWVAAGRPHPRSRGQLAAVAIVSALGLGLWATNWVRGARQIRSDNPPGLNPGALSKATFETVRRTLPNALDGAASPTLVNIDIPLGLSRVNGADPKEVLGIFAPEYRLTKWAATGTPIAIDDQGYARRVVAEGKPSYFKPQPACLSTRRGSQWLSKGSAGTLIELPPARQGRARVLEMAFGKTRSEGRIALSFQPSKNLGLPEAEVRVSPETPGLRILVPPVASVVAVSAWGGVSTCLGSVRTVYFAP